MIKNNTRIEIVSSTFKLSSMSKKSRDAAYAVLVKHYSNVRITIVNTVSDLEKLANRKPDLVLLGMKFVPIDAGLGLQDPAKVWVADYLDEHGIAYTGSRRNAHELEQEKPMAKRCVLQAGLKTSPFLVAQKEVTLLEDDITLNYPLFVKPANRGGGIGIDHDSVVRNFEQLQTKVGTIINTLHSDALIEEYLPGREISVAVLKQKNSEEYDLMPIERVAPPDKDGVRILSPEVKLADAGLSVGVTDLEVKNKVSELAISAFHALGGRDYGRVDIRLDAQGKPHFLEANLIPSIIEGYGNFAKACVLNCGLEYEPMLLRMVELGLTRQIEHIDEEVDQDGLITPSLRPVVEPT